MIGVCHHVKLLHEIGYYKLFGLGCLYTSLFLISAYQVARITGVHPWQAAQKVTLSEWGSSQSLIIFEWFCAAPFSPYLPLLAIYP
jgi:hypothetical protein